MHSLPSPAVILVTILWAVDCIDDICAHVRYLAVRRYAERDHLILPEDRSDGVSLLGSRCRMLMPIRVDRRLTEPLLSIGAHNHMLSTLPKHLMLISKVRVVGRVRVDWR